MNRSCASKLAAMALFSDNENMKDDESLQNLADVAGVETGMWKICSVCAQKCPWRDL